MNELCPILPQSNLTLDQVASLITTLGPGTLLFKFDVCAAYKQIRLIIDDWHLQGEMFLSTDGSLCFDFCSAANFGARSSGFLWEVYGKALEFMFRWVAMVDAIVRYIDDFLAMTAPHRSGHDLCRFLDMKRRILSLASDLGVEVDKFDEGTRLVFLGVLIDTKLLRFEVPPDRLRSTISELKGWSSRKGCTKRELQSVIGSLQYLTRIFPWGRAFLHRMIRLISNNRPPHAPVRLSLGLRLDIQWWLDVLPSWPGISLFYESSWAHLVSFEVDASILGHGCFWFPKWYSAPWSTTELVDAFVDTRVSMPYLELRAIAYACATFGHLWSRKKILCKSDCKSAVDVLNSKYSRIPRMQMLVRIIGVCCLSHNFDIRATHISGLLNINADPLSRLCPDSWLFDQAPIGTDALPTQWLDLPSTTYEIASGIC